MGTAIIGQLLAASLHEAVSETLPQRLDFYESWLCARGFRSRRVSLGGIRAVFSFLRLEDDQYDTVVRRAGELAATWMYERLPPIRRRLLRAMPRVLRVRAALALAKHLVCSTWEQTRVSARWHRGVGTFTVDHSLFCDVREIASAPLCGFYAAVVAGCIRSVGVEADVRVERCQARGEGACAIVVTLDAPGARPGAAAVLAAVLAGVMSTSLGARSQVPVSAARERVLVMPFENASQQARLAWLGEGFAILLADDLRSADVDAMTRDERLRAFDRFQLPPLATLSRATVIRIGELVGAADVVAGSMDLDGETLVLKARRIHLDTGRLDPETIERGPLGDFPAICHRLARRLWAGESEAASFDEARRRAGAAASPASFEQYVKGLLAEAPAGQVPFLKMALQLQPDFDAARIALAQAWTAAGDYRAAIDAVRPVSEGSPLAIDARFLASIANMHLREYGAAFQVLSGLQARAPSALFLNNLGVVRLRAASLPPDAGRAAWYFNQARTLDPLDPDYLFNLGYAHWLDGDPQGASYWLREAVRLAPTDGAAHALLAQALQAGGQNAEAAGELALAQRLSSAFEGLDVKSAPAATPPRGLERPKETLEPPRAQRIDAALEMVGQRDQRELSTFYLDRGRRSFERENDRDAESDLTRALYLSPYEAEAHLLLGRTYLRTGRLRQAIDAFKVSIWSQDTSAARVALAEAYLEARDPAAARAEAERALVLDPKSLHAQKLLERLR
jgi:Tfp pilus assembly protein PilF/predicted hydrocarbon binding protein/TolB-like protein